MAIKKWSQVPTLYTLGITTRICVVDGADPENMLISADNLFGSYLTAVRLDSWDNYVIGASENLLLSAALGYELKQQIEQGFTYVLTKAAVESVLTGQITTHSHILTKEMIENVFTGTISSHTHVLTKSMVESALTGTITSHTHASTDILTQAQKDVLNAFEIENIGTLENPIYRIKALYDLYSVGSISGYGEGTGGGGGSGLIQTVYTYLDILNANDSTFSPTSGIDTINANAAYQINKRIDEAISEAITNVAQDKHYLHDQGIPSSSWLITHNLNKYPSVTVVTDSGTIVEGGIEYLNPNQIQLTFTGTFSGKAYCN